MAHAHDRWTIVLFRGTTGNPLGTTGNPRKISVRKTTIKRVLLAVVILAVVQVGVLAQYMVQTSQVTNQGAELEGLKAELTQYREQAVEFAETIDDMQQRVLTIQSLSKKLQVMFGLEPEQRADETDVKGQGGEEVPYEAALDGATGMRDVDRSRRMERAGSPATPGPVMAANIKKQAVLARATDRARTPHADPVGKSSGRTGRPVGRDPVHLARQRPRVLKVWTTSITLYRKKGIPCRPGYQWPTRENRASPRQRQSSRGRL